MELTALKALISERKCALCSEHCAVALDLYSLFVCKKRVEFESWTLRCRVLAPHVLLIWPQRPAGSIQLADRLKCILNLCAALIIRPKKEKLVVSVAKVMAREFALNYLIQFRFAKQKRLAVCIPLDAIGMQSGSIVANAWPGSIETKWQICRNK